MTRKIIIVGNIGSDEHLRVMLKTLHALGCDIDYPTIESVSKILRDEYDIEISIERPLTIQEFALSKIDESLKQIQLISAKIKQTQQKKHQDFSRNQLQHYNHLQNIRIKTFKSRHR